MPSIHNNMGQDNFSLNMEITDNLSQEEILDIMGIPHSASQKRGNSSPLENEVAKRYMFDSNDLIQRNPYSALSPQEKEIPNANTNDAVTETRKPKIPPIFVHNATNYQEVVKDIQATTMNEFTTNILSSGLKVNVTSIEDFRSLTKYYDENNIQYHTFKNPDTEKLSVIIRNIPISLTEKEIKDGLIKLNLPIHSVTRLLNSAKRPIPVCAIELNKDKDANEIFNLTRFNYCVVSVEPRRKTRDIPQCKRCQRYGHTQNYCKLEARCVKCTGNHHYKDCPKTSDTEPQCVNCNGKHPANYKGCKYYTDTYKKTQSPQNQPQHASQANQERFSRTTSYTNPHRTFANATKNTPNATEKDHNNITADQTSSFFHTLLHLITPYLNHIKTFITSLLSTIFQNA